MRASIILIGLGLVLGLPTNVQAVDPDVKCEAAKVKEAAKYYACRLKAESKAIKKGEVADSSKCDGKYSEKWQKAESKAGPGVCPTEGDEAAIQARMTGDANDIVTLLGGGTLESCGDGVKNGTEDCDDPDLGGATCASLGFESGTLACSVGCGLDVSGCVPFSAGSFPASAQTTAFTADKNDGIGGAVSVPDDGTVQAGAALSYTDNGDGTITDNNTGLMWEKKGDNSTLHDVDNVYRWSGDGSQETIWDWLDDINNEGGTGFAGHSDWRIPNVKELQSIVDYGVILPTVDPVFETGCVATCTVTTCSCTAVNYWSSTSNPNDSVFAYPVSFSSGGVSNGDKSLFEFFVRAVRGGL